MLDRPVAHDDAGGIASAADLDLAFADFLRSDVANGDASTDTIRGYRTQVALWVSWCHAQAINPATAAPDTLKAYRQDLVSRAFKPTSIAHKLTIIRRFYQAAVSAGPRRDNPAIGIRPPRDKRARGLRLSQRG